MRLRIGVHYDLRGRQAEPDLTVLAEHAAALEEAGADVLWVAERPTEPDAWIAAALPVCAAMAARTERVRLGTAVLPLLLHHPLRVAEDAATLDALSKGRFELGVGLGGDREAASGFGVGGEARAGRLDEALELVCAAWQGPLDFAGRHFQAEGIEVLPRPVQAGGPPVWIGAVAPAAQRRAVRHHAGLILPAGASAEPYVAAWGSAGHRPEDARVALLLPEGPPGDAVANAERCVAGASAGARAARLDLVWPIASATALEPALAVIPALRQAHASAGLGI